MEKPTKIESNQGLEDLEKELALLNQELYKETILTGEGAESLAESAKEYTLKNGDILIAGTDKGVGKGWNEDRVVVHPEENFFAAIDGMGGEGEEGEGAVAAQILAENIARNPEDLETAVNEAILEMKNNKSITTGGALFISVKIKEEGGEKLLEIKQAGDCRLLIIRKDGSTFESEDESIVQDLVNSGDITPDQATFHPLRNRVSNAVSSEYFTTIKTSPDQKVEDGDLVLLMSDGISDNFTKDEIIKMRKDGSLTPEQLFQKISEESDKRMLNGPKIISSSKRVADSKIESEQTYSDGYKSKPKKDNRALIIVEIGKKEAKKVEDNKNESSKTENKNSDLDYFNEKIPSKIDLYFPAPNSDGSLDKKYGLEKYKAGASVFAVKDIGNGTYEVYIDKDPDAIKLADSHPETIYLPLFDNMSNALSLTAKELRVIKPAIVREQGEKLVLVEKGIIDTDGIGVAREKALIEQDEESSWLERIKNEYYWEGRAKAETEGIPAENLTKVEEKIPDNSAEKLKEQIVNKMEEGEKENIGQDNTSENSTYKKEQVEIPTELTKHIYPGFLKQITSGAETVTFTGIQQEGKSFVIPKADKIANSTAAVHLKEFFEYNEQAAVANGFGWIVVKNPAEFEYDEKAKSWKIKTKGYLEFIDNKPSDKFNQSQYETQKNVSTTEEIQEKGIYLDEETFTKIQIQNIPGSQDLMRVKINNEGDWKIMTKDELSNLYKKSEEIKNKLETEKDKLYQENLRKKELENPHVTIDDYIRINPILGEVGKEYARQPENLHANLEEAKNCARLSFKYLLGEITAEEMISASPFYRNIENMTVSEIKDEADEASSYWKEMLDQINEKYDKKISSIDNNPAKKESEEIPPVINEEPEKQKEKTPDEKRQEAIENLRKIIEENIKIIEEETLKGNKIQAEIDKILKKNKKGK